MVPTYLARSVRGAQRWERELGLPVHRIKTPGGQIIDAVKSEIDRWKLQAEGKLANEGAEPAPGRPVARARSLSP